MLTLTITLLPAGSRFAFLVALEVLEEPARTRRVHELYGRDCAAAGVDSATPGCVGSVVAALLDVVIIVSTILAFISLHRFRSLVLLLITVAAVVG